MPEKTITERLFEKPLTFLMLLVGFQFLLHIPIFDLPPLGQHVWRQVVGSSIAYNYFSEGSSFLNTLVDIRVHANDTGAIYHEFPITYWLVGNLYKVFGFKDFIARIVPFIFNCFLIFGAYYLGTGLSLLEE